jgi:hypothetical protein
MAGRATPAPEMKVKLKEPSPMLRTRPIDACHHRDEKGFSGKEVGARSLSESYAGAGGRDLAGQGKKFTLALI